MKHEWSTLKVQATGLLPGVGVSIVVILLVLFFAPSLLWLLIGIVSGSILWDAFQNYRSGITPVWYHVVREQVANIAYTLLIFYVGFFLGFWGVLGVVASVVLIGAIVLWRRRVLYMETLRSIERMIWGKPLDEPKKEEVKKDGA